MRFVLGALLMSACGGGPDVDPPLVDGAVAPDAAFEHGLRVAWSADPSIPGEHRAGITVTSATFRVASLQVIGDAGGGAGTTRTDLVVDFTEQGQLPMPTEFPGAPVGLYSKLSLQLDGDAQAAYEIVGTARVGGNFEPFRIRDTLGLNIEIDDYEVTLDPGEDATLAIELDLRAVFGPLNFGQVMMLNGERLLDETGAQIGMVRDALPNAFRRGGS